MRVETQPAAVAIHVTTTVLRLSVAILAQVFLTGACGSFVVFVLGRNHPIYFGHFNCHIWDGITCPLTVLSRPVTGTPLSQVKPPVAGERGSNKITVTVWSPAHVLDLSRPVQWFTELQQNWE